MMMSKTMSMAANDDAKLVSESLAGNRDAFEQIVERHQSLICSLAYSATGSLGQSVELAQETFITAWKDLATLREPAKLRPWLCSIMRCLIWRYFRRSIRRTATGGANDQPRGGKYSFSLA
jgi:DNA-directed RNA polymerase specialized sigma24 family protein